MARLKSARAVAIADHEPGGHLSEAICRVGNEDTAIPRKP
jgi:hypothetical protein